MPDPRVARGYAVWTDPDGPSIERDTITCFHCQHVIHVKPGSAQTVYLLPPHLGAPLGTPWREEMGGGCYTCQRPICLACIEKGGCDPWERQLDRIEARVRLHRAVGI
jgi:hypothetical protein